MKKLITIAVAATVAAGSVYAAEKGKAESKAMTMEECHKHMKDGHMKDEKMSGMSKDMKAQCHKMMDGSKSGNGMMMGQASASSSSSPSTSSSASHSAPDEHAAHHP